MTKPKFRFSRKLLAIPYALFLAFLVVAPLLIIVYYAFTDANGAFTFDNVILFFSGSGGDSFFQSASFKTIVQSLFISVMSTVVCLLIAYPVAYIIAKSKLKNKMGLLLLFIVPMWVNFVLRVNALKELLDWIGIYNKSNSWNLFNTILGMVYDFLPYMVLPIYTSMTKLDNRYLEAAADLGCNSGKTLLRVILPLTVPGIVSGVTMVFVPSISTFYISQKLGGGSFDLIGDVIERQFKNAVTYHTGAAISLVMMVLILISVAIMNRFSDGEEGPVV